MRSMKGPNLVQRQSLAERDLITHGPEIHVTSVSKERMFQGPVNLSCLGRYHTGPDW